MCIYHKKYSKGPTAQSKMPKMSKMKKAVTHTGCQLTDYPLKYLLANVFGTAVKGHSKLVSACWKDFL